MILYDDFVRSPWSATVQLPLKKQAAPAQLSSAGSRHDEIILHMNRQGLLYYNKVSYPVRYGRFHEIIFAGHTCHLNINGEIKFIQGCGNSWPHPSEWLKRTVVDDWVYYAVHGYEDTFDRIGEYYLPCFSYAGNALLQGIDFTQPAIRQAMAVANRLPVAARNLLTRSDPDPDAAALLARMAAATPEALRARADRLHRILRGRIPVLPPDCRHVDYEVIPLMISEGCLYNCGFCCVKTGGEFRVRDRAEIRDQIHALAGLYRQDLVNYNSLFLGQNDALAAGTEVVCHAAETAYHDLGFAGSLVRRPSIFLFGSVDSFLAMTDADWARLNALPLAVYINIGLESFDQTTLEQLAKPIRADAVRAAFTKMLAVNRQWPDIEISGNILLAEHLPENHIPALVEVLTDLLPRYYPKGTLYLSPLAGSSAPGLLLQQFRTIKALRRLDTYLYLIQRL